MICSDIRLDLPGRRLAAAVFPVEQSAMDETVRRVARAIAEAWWRKNNRRSAGSVPEAGSPSEYADNFWQGFTDEARAAIAAIEAAPSTSPNVYSGSAFLAPIS